MNKLTSVLALAAAMALASPQAMAANTRVAGHKSVASRPAKRVKKTTLRKGKKAQKENGMATKRMTKKKIVSHRKAPRLSSIS